jgi:hypothetical protein
MMMSSCRGYVGARAQLLFSDVAIAEAIAEAAHSESKSSRELSFRPIDIVTGEGHGRQVGLASRPAFKLGDSLRGSFSQRSSFTSDGDLSNALDVWHATVKRSDELVQMTNRTRAIRWSNPVVR